MDRPPPANLTRQLRRAPTQFLPISKLARGGMAEVWVADAIFEGGESHPVAIKRVHPHLVDNGLYRSMFEDETRLGMKLRHRNIVRVYDGRDVGGALLMIMEYVDGVSLKALLARAHARGARMPAPTALFVAREIASALAYAHDAREPSGSMLNVVHRDVSPHNVLLSKQGQVKLADFGLADASVHETAQDEDMVAGKLGYLAPEALSRRPSDFRADLYGLGILLWEMLAGRTLFQAPTTKETLKNVSVRSIPKLCTESDKIPPSVDELLHMLLARAPADRPASAAACVRHMDALLSEMDSNVGERSVALLVGLHCASGDMTPSAPPRGIEALEAQLSALIAEDNAGYEPLNPSDFAFPSPGTQK